MDKEGYELLVEARDRIINYDFWNKNEKGFISNTEFVIKLELYILKVAMTMN